MIGLYYVYLYLNFVALTSLCKIEIMVPTINVCCKAVEIIKERLFVYKNVCKASHGGLVLGAIGETFAFSLPASMSVRAWIQHVYIVCPVSPTLACECCMEELGCWL